MVFSAPIKGKVLQLLSHHIIYGEIVVPGPPRIPQWQHCWESMGALRC